MKVKPKQIINNINHYNKRSELTGVCDVCEAGNKPLKCYQQLHLCPECLKRVYNKTDAKKAASYKLKVDYYSKRRDLDQ